MYPFPLPVRRETAMQDALKAAIEVPLSVVQVGNSCWPHLITLAQYGNISTKSDLQVTVVASVHHSSSRSSSPSFTFILSILHIHPLHSSHSSSPSFTFILSILHVHPLHPSRSSSPSFTFILSILHVHPLHPSHSSSPSFTFILSILVI